MLPKRLRAELHERFADWLERTTGGGAGAQDEILGYHLAQAHDYRAELEGESERTRARWRGTRPRG